MSFWRKLNTLVFKISLVVFSLALVGASIWGFLSWRWWIGLIILVGGAVLIPIIFSAWGILLEFLDNVAAIRRQVCGQPMVMNTMPAQMGVIPSPEMAQMNVGVPQQVGVPMSAGMGTFSDMFSQPDKWICDGCGKKNDGDAAFCYNCGKPKG